MAYEADVSPLEEFIKRVLDRLEQEARIEKAQGYDARAQGIRTAIVIVIRESLAEPGSLTPPENGFGIPAA